MNCEIQYALFVLCHSIIIDDSFPVQPKCKIIGISFRIDIGLHIPWDIFELLLYGGHIQVAFEMVIGQTAQLFPEIMSIKA